MNCEKCGKEIDEGTKFCPHCGSEQLAEKAEPLEAAVTETAKNDEKETVLDVGIDASDNIETNITNKPKDKKKFIILGVLAFIALIAIGFGVKSYMDSKAREEYVAAYNQYVDDIGTIKMDMLEAGVKAENACNLTLKVWSNAIWKRSDKETDAFTKPNGKFVDFDTALINMTKDSDVMATRVSVSTAIDTVSEKMEKMKNPPEELKEQYETLKEMYSRFEDFMNAAVTPTGSYTSYNSSVISLDTEFIRLYKKVDGLNLKHIEE